MLRRATGAAKCPQASRSAAALSGLPHPGVRGITGFVTSNEREQTTARRGAVCGLLAAALFGVSPPLAKLLLGEVTPQVLAGLLYLGAGVAVGLYRWLSPSTEPPLRRPDLPLMAAVVLTGGVVGPLAMLLGLQRTTAVAGALLLNLEAPFTILLAAAVFGEHLGRQAVTAALLIVAGALLLSVQPGQVGAHGAGVLLLAIACAAWAIDNNLTQRLSLHDPVAVVRVKTLAAGSVNLLLGLWVAGGALPGAAVIVAALLLGSVSYGASVVLDVYALRLVGAAREAAYFATGPFFGALAAKAILGERLGFSASAAAVLMAGGIVLFLRERHVHLHGHQELDHTHAHVHDRHHVHEHGSADPAGDPHVHRHRHTNFVHAHAHVPDAHHRHRHSS
ncbi:MAG: hypothetical protein QOD06_2614 [Candidatus Binatota bacterium]|jgi:drug/metabolite transporter (DMT)-like permease|nr:hypothetical protein [Candidatus Binatota bacterium]